jgi:hypothetical protein
MMFQVDTERQQEEEVVEMSLEEIKGHIKIYPTSTEGMIHVLFDEEILGKIVKAEVLIPMVL